MPIYEYACGNHRCDRYTERFALLRSFSKMAAPAKCSDCGHWAYRCVVPSSPASFRMGGIK